MLNYENKRDEVHYKEEGKEKKLRRKFIVNEENYEYINYEKRLHSVGTACTLMHKMPNKR
jgi:hypothetical protein